MKRIQNVLLIAVALIFTACSGAISEEKLVGTWQITDFSTTVELSPMIIESSTEIALTTRYELAEGTFVETMSAMGDEIRNTGTWELKEEGKEMQMTYDSAPEEAMVSHYQIKSYSDSKMVWVVEYEEIGTSEIVLERQ